MRNDDVEDLIAQLTRLQVQQTDLLVRLERATHNSIVPSYSSDQEGRERTASPVSVSVAGDTSAFAIGDRVKIKNPNLFQTDKGAITKIGKKRITVTTASGQKIIRAAKNIIAI
jgi:hypothetical protein